MAANPRASGAKAESVEQALHQATLEAAVDGILTIDARGRLQSANPSACRLFGYDEDELRGRNVKLLMPSPYREEHDTYLHTYLTTKKKRIIGIGRRVTGQRRDGSTFPLQLSVGEAVVGNEPYFVGVVHDLSVNVRADDLSRILEDSLNEIFIFDAATLRFLQVNYGARQNLGYSMEELSELTPVDIKPEMSAQQFAELVAPLRKGAEESLVFETVHERKDKTLYCVEVHLQLATLGGRAVFVAIILDITTRKESEERTRHLEQLASISTLTAGIAHDVGTPMSVILGYTGLLQRQVTDEKALSQLNVIADQVERVTNLIGTLLDLARPREPVRVRVGLAELVDMALDFFAEKLKKHDISVERDYETRSHVSGDPEKLQQVFMNLFLNATHAMPEGGTLSVAIREVGDHVDVRIRDEGVGMDSATVDQVFEPFFTTKPRGEGTGLGLVVARSIVLDHEGAIAVTSEPGKGSEFQILFPLADAEGA